MKFIIIEIIFQISSTTTSQGMIIRFHKTLIQIENITFTNNPVKTFSVLI